MCKLITVYVSCYSFPLLINLLKVTVDVLELSDCYNVSLYISVRLVLQIFRLWACHIESCTKYNMETIPRKI